MRWLFNLLLISITMVIGALSVEWALRAFTDRSVTYGIWYHPELNEVRYRWQFIKNVGDTEVAWSKYDPLLGWDKPKAEIANSPDFDEKNQPLKILFVGDSFVQGDDVQKTEAFAYVLAGMMKNIETINLAVSGFGIDQSYLKLLRDGLDEKPDIVVFGIHPPNFERASISFFSGPKPQLALNSDGDVYPINTPLSKPSPFLAKELQDELSSRSVLIDYIKVIIYRYFNPIRRQHVAKYFSDMNRLVEKMLLNAKAAVEKVGGRMVVLQIPHGMRFRDEKSRADWRRTYPLDTNLIELYRTSGIAYIDLDSEFSSRLSMNDVFRNYYIHPTPDDAGHLSVQGNKIVAEILMRAFCGTDTLQADSQMLTHCPTH